MQNYLYFFKATILNWQKLLKQDKYKQIICDSLSYLVKKNRVVVLLPMVGVFTNQYEL